MFKSMPWWSWPLAFAPLYLLARRMGTDSQRGRVVGIVGRMGSGKSYFAVRMAWARMNKGANIYTNFSMKLEPWHEAPCPEKCVRKMRCKCVRRCPCQMASRWHRFEGWEQFADITNAVVIIDEVDLYAPSHDPRAIPDYVRWKLKMCRKHKIDLYWIAQGESRVSRLLRDVLTNEIRVCQSWLGGLYFTAKTYDPKHVGRARKHTSRSGYRMRTYVANLYDTLETIRGDEERGDGTMSKANALADAHEAGRSGAGAETRRAAVVARRMAEAKCVELRPDGRRYCTNKVVPGEARCRKHGGRDEAGEREAELSALATAARTLHLVPGGGEDEPTHSSVHVGHSEEAGVQGRGRGDAQPAEGEGEGLGA